RTLARIEALQPQLNAFVTVMAEEARRQARALEQELADGLPPRPLHGIPIAVKDNIDVAGVRTTAGSRVRSDVMATADATVVARLREAGAVIVGKTATHEFAFGVTTDTPYHGPVHNPWRAGHTAGGSSGGSGAAVAARIVPAALGTDTGGSIRIPAAACGTVGFKGTYGLVSKHGVVPLSWSLDHVGPLANSVDDAVRVLAAIAGPDPLDPTTLGPAQRASSLMTGIDAGGDPADLRDVSIGLPAGWLEDRIDPEVRARIDEALRLLAGLGARIEEVPYPPAGVMALINRILALAEGGAYHAATLAQRGGDYAPDVRARFELGLFLLAQDYLSALRLRTEVARMTYGALDRVTVLVTPTMPIPAPPLGQAVWSWPAGPEAVPDAMIRLTAPFSLIGFPALCVPCGTAGGMPVSLQVVGRPLGEASTVRVGRALERALTGR
ncbi:MAG TPA: amidase, partial [Bacillota bacterium]